MKPEIDWGDHQSVNVKMGDVEVGDIIYEKGHQIVVMSSPEHRKTAVGSQWTFTGLCHAGGLKEFITTVDSPYKLDLTWEPTFTPMIRVDGSVKNMFDSPDQKIH